MMPQTHTAPASETDQDRAAAPANAGPDDVIATYEAVAGDWAAARDRSLMERRWLDRLLAVAPGGRSRRRILDLGCGTGRPIATYLAERGCAITGVDASRTLLRHFQDNLPQARAFHLDMRGLDLGEEFDVILAWDSFFHLSAADQRAMIATFGAHAGPGAALLFTSGHVAGTAIGEIGGRPIFHESLAPEEYHARLTDAGFRVIEFVPEDPECGGHTVWLARRDPERTED